MNYLVLARGTSLGAARVLAVSADPQLVNKFVAELAGEAEYEAKKLDERGASRPPGSLRVVRGDEE